MQGSIVEETILTPYLTEETREKVKEARLAQYQDGSKTFEIMFSDAVPKIERNIILVAIGENLINILNGLTREEETENRNILRFMDGAKIKEWEV